MMYIQEATARALPSEDNPQALPKTTMSLKIEQLPEQIIFPPCFGHPNEKPLADLIAKTTTSTIVQHEPPSLLLPKPLLGERFIRHFQRNHIVKNEDLGRGIAIDWLDNRNNQPLAKIAERKMAKIKLHCYEQLAKNYVEINQYMIRLYGEELIKFCPTAKILIINTSPISYALAYSAP